MATSSGICFLCEQAVQRRNLAKHLEKCLENGADAELQKIFLIEVYDAKKMFWLFVEINGSSKLKILDDFLRETWLDCCGHLSEFVTKKGTFAVDTGLGQPIEKLFDVGDTFDYSYDFGSTTELQGKIISVRSGKLSKHVRLVTRNIMPEEVKCSACGKLPEIICAMCYDFCCNSCTKKHNKCEGEDFFLPVVNSPRMGVCGYTGD